MTGNEHIFKDRMAFLMQSVDGIIQERFSDDASVLVVVYETIGDGSDSESLMIGSCRVAPEGLDAFLLTALVARGVMPDGTVERWLMLKAAGLESAATSLKRT